MGVNQAQLDGPDSKFRRPGIKKWFKRQFNKLIRRSNKLDKPNIGYKGWEY